jgi:signal transduction histidine kinase/CheY-like chemotaxis protein/CHASE3 domain sensor protein
MKNNFKRNLLLGFGASLLILGVSSVASFLSIRALLTSAEWVNHTNEVIIEMDRLSSTLTDAETSQRGYLLTGDSEFLDTFNDFKMQAMNSYEQVKTLTTDNVTQQKSVEDLSTLMNERFNYLQLSIDRKRKGETIITDDLRTGETIMDKIRALVGVMEDREQALLAERTAAMNKFSSFTPILIVFAAITALIITGLFYVRVRSDFDERAKLQLELQQKDEEISRRIDIISGLADKISTGDYRTRINDQQSDSLGNVAGSLNKMAQSLDYSFGLLSHKEWLQTGLTNLNNVMIGDKTVETLTHQVVDFIATYTKSNAAALYILERDELLAVAGFAYKPNKSREKFRIGEGLIGQAVVTGQLVELNDIPAESITITFATGQAKPNHIIVVPIFDGYTIKGAVELATIHSFTERDVEFLKTAAHNVGIAITSAQNRRRLQELLEETQSQTEELKTQHNELENMNSELEVQAEKLQASEEELKVQQEELKQANQELEERSRLLEDRNQVITERNVDIQTKADQLAQSTKYKSEFLANMSHELRTPLNSILLLSRLMAEDQQKNLTPEQIEYAKVIQSSGNGLLSLIDEILDLSKIESGKMELDYHPLAIQEIIHDMSSLFTPLATEKKIEFKTAIGEGVPTAIETDKLRLEQILRNLLSNAIKFTAHGHVGLSVQRDEKRKNYLKFTVSDTGIGIPKEKQALVFEAFQQADGSTRRKYGGTGLGLSISRELVKLLEGEISVQSEVEKGSVFAISIPMSKAAVYKLKEEQPEPVLQPSPIYLEAVATERKYLSTHIPQNIPDDRNEVREGDRVMLIIEDDVNFGKSLLDYTRKKGYKGIVAVRGDEGIELARHYLPLGIMLDIQLPIKSGWEVMEELKSTPETRHIPVHIMSSYEVKSESLLKGAVDFINKPFAFDQMQDIFSKIEYVLTHHPKKVLIVEENAKHAKALAYFLETFDVNLEIKSQIAGAIQSLQDDSVDCVILDMGIPDQKSYDTLEAVKKTPGLENMPIIIFTGKSLSHSEELRIKQYADSIVVKTAHSYKRILDEVSLFLHLVEKSEQTEPAKPRYHKLGAMDEVLKDKTVLIADDDMRNIFSLSKSLEKYQMKVITAVDGKDALKKLKATPTIDIVLMDMMMPEMDGYESTAAIRKDPALKDIPVIAVTAKAMMGDREKCIKAGASDYITKPVDIDQLFSLLRVWLYEK